MPMNPRLLRPLASGVHPEAAAWRTAVVANGGSVSASTMNAVSKFCRDIDAAGIRDRFWRLNLFCGNSDASLNAVRTPLFRGPSRTGTQYGGTTDTNNNFVQGDYAETGASGGLLGNGTSKYFNTGLNASEFNRNNSHLGVYGTALDTAGTTFGSLAGARSASFTNTLQLDGRRSGAGTNFFRSASGTDSVLVTPGLSAGHVIGVSASGTDMQIYNNGTSAATNTIDRGSGALAASPVFVFSVSTGSSPGDYSSMRCRAYSIGMGMSAAQVASFYTALHAFQTALGRNA